MLSMLAPSNDGAILGVIGEDITEFLWRNETLWTLHFDGLICVNEVA